MSDEKDENIIHNIDEVVKISDADLAADAAKEAADAEAAKVAYKSMDKAKAKRSYGGGGDKAEEIKTEEGGILIHKNLSQVMHESMIPYSEFVILDRALPRVEDGLKPVQRRILYTMNELGLMPEKPFRKSAAIVGECLGKYHPHGDTSVYDAMVRMAQPFNMNMPLVTGQGNFGNEDGDSPAAMRYTEAKLSPLALELLRDIEKDTVPFSLTYDDRNTEPDVLPGRYPNLLTNGATGIAVGLATNIPPHNLGEVIDAHIAYIDNPRITLGQVMKIIKGPDFPTAGFIVVGDDLTQAYKTGKGRVIMRGKVHIEVEGNDRRSIVVSEFPYQVNKVTWQKALPLVREAKKGALQGIQEIKDESDRNGARVVLKIKNGFDAKEIVDMLYKHTNLQTNFNINTVAIANGKPKLLGLMQLIQYYCEYQREVIYKRSMHDLHNARDRAHIVEGLLVAIKNIDEVVRIIKTSKHTTEARQRLRDTFSLSEKQAQAILDLRLARLTSLEVYKLEQELEDLKKIIAKLEKIIASKRLQYEEVKKELLEIKRKYKVERRSRVLRSLEETPITADDDAKPIEEVVVTLTAAGTIKRMDKKHYSMSNTEFKAGMKTSDANLVVIQTQTDKMLYIFTDRANTYKLEISDIPECKLRDKGVFLNKIFKLAGEGEKPIAIYEIVHEQLPGAEGVESKLTSELVWLSKFGMIKRSTWVESCAIQKSIFQSGKLNDGDELLRVDEFKPSDTIMLLSSSGSILHAQTNDVPVQGRIAGGVKGINMEEGVLAVCNTVSKRNGFIVAITNKGNIKRTPVKDIDKMVRYRKGLMFGPALSAGEKYVFGAVVKGEEDLVAQTADGRVVHIPVAGIKEGDRTAKFKQKLGDNIVSAWIHRRKRNN
ncbi:MAG: DNA topoisomerase 4 subunit A [Firmicutes bacterium]|nr:DNA topoisomerase 4 subunit A [Bacillota bacterium]